MFQQVFKKHWQTGLGLHSLPVPDLAHGQTSNQLYNSNPCRTLCLATKSSEKCESHSFTEDE